MPELVQPSTVLLAGAIPFIEHGGVAAIGVLGAINPILAGVAAASGNFLCVLVVVLLSSRARAGIVNRRADQTETAHTAGESSGGLAITTDSAPTKPESKGQLHFKKWLVRFGVPGASLLGPFAIPTQFTCVMLVAAGIPRGRVLLWQARAIVLWTTVTTVLAWIAFTAVLDTN